MNIVIGTVIEHGTTRFVVVDIKHNVTADGAVLQLVAFDPEMAKQERQKAITMEQTGNSIMELVKKVVEGGGIGGFSKGD
jgi:biotin synthase-related radical SAM superfamily protein